MRLTALALAACGLVFAACSSGSVADADEPTALAVLEPVLTATLEARDSVTEPGFILRMQTRSGEVLDITAGAQSIEQSRPISDQSVFHIASLSKQITGAALALAIEDGLVSLDDPVAEWLPGAAHFGPALTVGHLAYMTSGVPEYYEQDRESGFDWYTGYYFDVEEAIAASLDQPELLFQPGSAWQYSNINYMLLTEIVSAAYDSPFSSVVETRLFAPLGMTASLIHDDTTALISNRADAYYERTPGMVEAWASAGIDIRTGTDFIAVRRNAAHYGGSGVMTSMADWSLWQDELMSQEVLGEAFWTIMLARRPYGHDKTNDALGLVHGDYNGWPTLWYEGGDIDT
ncbi:MAG: serine hydrolase domain-containing protein, partial [Pseudomonadota bacterium]